MEPIILVAENLKGVLAERWEIVTICILVKSPNYLVHHKECWRIKQMIKYFFITDQSSAWESAGFFLKADLGLWWAPQAKEKRKFILKLQKRWYLNSSKLQALKLKLKASSKCTNKSVVKESPSIPKSIREH